MSKENWPMSEKCKHFLLSYWNEEKIEKGLKDPVKFVRKVINPWIRERRKQGKNFPLVYIRTRDDSTYLILSDEKTGK